MLFLSWESRTAKASNTKRFLVFQANSVVFIYIYIIEIEHLSGEKKKKPAGRMINDLFQMYITDYSCDFQKYCCCIKDFLLFLVLHPCSESPHCGFSPVLSLNLCLLCALTCSNCVYSGACAAHNQMKYCMSWVYLVLCFWALVSNEHKWLVVWLLHVGTHHLLANMC